MIVVHAQGGTSYLPDGVLSQLNAIAPVVTMEVFQPVEDVTRRVAELVGGDASTAIEAERVAFEATLAELAEIVDVDGLSVSFALHFAPDGIYTYGPTQLPAVDVLTRAGARWVPVVDDAVANGGDLQLSLERVGELDADLMIAYNLGDADLATLPVVADLPAARAGQLVVLPETHQAITWRNYTNLAQQYIDLLSPLAPLDLDVAPAT